MEYESSCSARKLEFNSQETLVDDDFETEHCSREKLMRVAEFLSVTLFVIAIVIHISVINDAKSRGLWSGGLQTGSNHSLWYNALIGGGPLKDVIHGFFARFLLASILSFCASLSAVMSIFAKPTAANILLAAICGLFGLVAFFTPYSLLD